MTRAALKALIEPTQDGAKFSRDERDALHQSDPLMDYIESAIDGAEDVGDLSEKLEYAVSQLRRAYDALRAVKLSETIED